MPKSIATATNETSSKNVRQKVCITHISLSQLNIKRAMTYTIFAIFCFMLDLQSGRPGFICSKYLFSSKNGPHLYNVQYLQSSTFTSSHQYVWRIITLFSVSHHAMMTTTSSPSRYCRYCKRVNRQILSRYLIISINFSSREGTDFGGSHNPNRFSEENKGCEQKWIDITNANKTRNVLVDLFLQNALPAKNSLC